MRARCKACEAAIRSGEPVPVPTHTPATMLPRSDTYVLTYAQNATPVDSHFWAALQAYAEHRKAVIGVIAGRYHNPTSHWSARAAAQDWWDGELEPVLVSGEHALGPKVRAYTGISIQPTAVDPLSGFEVFVRGGSGIFGHTKQAWKSIPSGKPGWPRMLISTGACTVANYTESKAGAKAEKHHTLGAVVVETHGKYFWVRHLEADDTGGFYDLDRYYSAAGPQDHDGVGAIVLGDSHASHPDKSATKAADALIADTRPAAVVAHDVLTMHARPKHSAKRLTTTYDRHKSCGTVEDELKQALEHIESRVPEGAQGFVVDSNHHDHMLHWLEDADIKTDPENARLYHWLWHRMLTDRDETGEFPQPFELWCRDRKSDRVRFLRPGEELEVNGVVCAYHGHAGPNGTRGSILGYAKMGIRSVVGHSHTPGRRDGCTQVGTIASLDQGYNRGQPSTWFHACAVVYPNGKVQLVTLVNGKHRR